MFSSTKRVLLMQEEGSVSPMPPTSIMTMEVKITVEV